ncbi:TetR/AcrR family transcriptional regulator [Niallia sp. 03133]|uniref:TetR/AcrR family transcriptional regulator n=1 Tax=Niallia sp. 03133 TaxID=3458060 RepID=UPI0040440DFE
MSCTKENNAEAIANLKNTMMSLLVKKDIRYIKTKEITEQAHVSRSIMFQYYKDKYALFNNIVEEMKIELKQTVASTYQEKKGAGVEQLNKEMNSVLHFVTKNHLFFQTLMDRDVEPYVDFYQFFLQSCQKEKVDYPSKKGDFSAYYQALYYYAISLYWLKDECRFSSDYICEMFHKYRCDKSIYWFKETDIRKKKCTNPCRIHLEEAIQNAFIELMMEKESYMSITISDITKKSNVRRASFYNYYASKEELFKAIIEKECTELLKYCVVENKGETLTIKQMEWVINQLFLYLSDHKTIFYFMDKDYGVPNLLTEMFYQFSGFYTQDSFEEKGDTRLYSYYIAGVLIALILYFVHHQIEQTPNLMAQQLRQWIELNFQKDL